MWKDSLGYTFTILAHKAFRGNIIMQPWPAVLINILGHTVTKPFNSSEKLKYSLNKAATKHR